MGLDYCVLPPSENFEDFAVFTKDQLVSLIEIDSPETLIAEIPKMTQSAFKPFAVFRPGSPPDGFADSENLQALTVEEDGASVSPLKEALQPRAPRFPPWWEAPVPFAMCEYGRLHVNQTALLMFGPDLTRLSARDIPEKNEFLVTLEGKGSPCTLTFRRLEKDIFMLDDCTSEVAEAADIAWWAAVGKAWAASLDKEGCVYHRRVEKDEGAGGETAYFCEWGGDFLGYFCVKKNADESEKEARKKETAMTKLRALADKLALLSPLEKSGEAKTESAEEKEKKEIEEAEGETTEEETEEGLEEGNEALKALGPQTMGLLTPGTEFFVLGEANGEANSGKEPQEEDEGNGMLKTLGPQTMGILAAGTDFIVPEEPDDEDDAKELEKALGRKTGD
jgi:hypothetical protein